MSVDLFAALGPFIAGVAPLFGGSLDQLNTMSATDYGSENA